MIIQFDNTRQRRSCGIISHKVSHNDCNISVKHLILTGGKTKCERCKEKRITTDFEDDLNFEEQNNSNKNNTVKSECNVI